MMADPENIRAAFHRHISRYLTWLVAESGFFLTLVKCQEPCRWQHDRNRQENGDADAVSPMNCYEAFSILMPAPIPTLTTKAENDDTKPLEGRTSGVYGYTQRRSSKGSRRAR
jgi:hypothetical protein